MHSKNELIRFSTTFLSQNRRVVSHDLLSLPDISKVCGLEFQALFFAFCTQIKNRHLVHLIEFYIHLELTCKKLNFKPPFFCTLKSSSPFFGNSRVDRAPRVSRSLVRVSEQCETTTLESKKKLLY